MLEELMSNMDVARHNWQEEPTTFNEFAYYSSCCKFDNYVTKLYKGELEKC